MLREQSCANESAQEKHVSQVSRTNLKWGVDGEARRRLKLGEPYLIYWTVLLFIIYLCAAFGTGKKDAP